MFRITFHNNSTKCIEAPDEETLQQFLSQYHLSDLVQEIRQINSDEMPDAVITDTGTLEFGQYVEWWYKKIKLDLHKPQNSYLARRYPDDSTEVLINDLYFNPNPSLAVRNHSPTGFEWNYAGSGPAQLALAILLEETGDPEIALSLYQTFKNEVIAVAPKQGWTLTSHEIKQWIDHENQNTLLPPQRRR